MDNKITDFRKSVLANYDKGKISISEYELTNEEILIEFPYLNEEEIEILKNEILIISEITYNSFK
jgi:hypothetical protein